MNLTQFVGFIYFFHIYLFVGDSGSSQVLKLLQGDEEITRWARQEVSASDELDALDGEAVPTNIKSHLNMALLDLEDDSLSTSSGEQSISVEDYLRGRWSRSTSFD